ncbi:MAG: metallophosphoesterase [Bacteroidota bacterium]
MSRIYFFVFLVIVYFSIDFYVFHLIRVLSENLSSTWKRTIFICYWGVSTLLLVGIFLYRQIDPKQFSNLRLYVVTVFFIIFIGKLFTSVFLLLEDLRRGIAWFANQFSLNEQVFSSSRSDFMKKASLMAGAVPIATMTFGIISGAHDYRVRRRTVYFNNLPKSFDGIRIAQISDIHTGSFFNKTAVEGGVDLLLSEKPDLTFFTGDLVNNKSEEAEEYLDIFKRIKSPLGVFSVMGNHDYGDYSYWPSIEAKKKDVKNIHSMHKYMGYDLLLNENRTVKIEEEEIAILGCENWGSGRFSKYGDLDKCIAGVENVAFKILLSHDPSHWDAQIRPKHSDIDLTLAGHTHGLQFGIEIGDFRWSPAQYRYKQWADLYQEGEQYLYVNRGYGYIGYPGRIGILPEITILELNRV